MEMLSRFDRIIAIYIHLQSGRVIKARDLADRFGVSLRTIYRDIRSLELAGVPLVGEAGMGYSIMDGYRLPPVMFTREEAGSFVAAQQLMHQYSDKKLNAHFISAMYKLKSVLRGNVKDRVDALERQVWRSSEAEVFNNQAADALEILLESIAEKKQVVLLYHAFSSDEATERIIEPIGLFTENNYWHIIGFCHLRNDYRQFRTDRILSIKRTDKPFTRDHQEEVALYHTKKDCGEKQKIVIRVERRIARYVQNSRKFYGFEGERTIGDQVEMTFMITDNGDSLARWFLMIGDVAEIVEPESFRSLVASMIEHVRGKLLTANAV